MGFMPARSACQLRPAVCDPVDWGLPGSSSHGISQARILERVPLPPPGDFPTPGLNPVSRVSCVGRWTLHHRATWEAQHVRELKTVPGGARKGSEEGGRKGDLS